MPLISNYTESTRSFHIGFILNEQELRRIIEVINDQYDKKGAPNPVIKYTVKHENGLVAETYNFSDVLKIENVGSQKIKSITITAVSTIQSDDEITINFFTDSNEKSDENPPMKYKVRGTERDWVMITSSLIDERLSRIKNTDFSSFFSRGVFFVSYIIFITFFFGVAIYQVDDTHQVTRSVLLVLEKKISKNENVDLLPALISIEKSKLVDGNFRRGFSSPMTLIAIVLMLMTVFSDYIRKAYYRYFPYCVFYWGDYIDKYERMKKNRNLLLGLVFGSILLGLITNLLSSYIWDKYTG